MPDIITTPYFSTKEVMFVRKVENSAKKLSCFVLIVNQSYVQLYIRRSIHFRQKCHLNANSDKMMGVEIGM